MKLIVKNGKVGFVGKYAEGIKMHHALCKLSTGLNQKGSDYAPEVNEVKLVNEDSKWAITISYDTDIFTARYVRALWTKANK